MRPIYTGRYNEKENGQRSGSKFKKRVKGVSVEKNFTDPSSSSTVFLFRKNPNISSAIPISLSLSLSRVMTD